VARNGELAGVLLINLPNPHRQNLGLGYLAASLRRKGQRVEIFEPRPSSAFGDNAGSCIPQVMQKEFAVLGISLYAPGVEEAARLVQTVRNHKPGVHICLGGNFSTVAFREILQDADFRGVDSIVLC
jgi:anaerobic magnesium-protoporphyrin IX monomethyl ester cyclase